MLDAVKKYMAEIWTLLSEYDILARTKGTTNTTLELHVMSNTGFEMGSWNTETVIDFFLKKVGMMLRLCLQSE